MTPLAAAAAVAASAAEAPCSSTDDDAGCYLDCYWMLSLRLNVQMHAVHVAAIVVAEKSMHACTAHNKREREKEEKKKKCYKWQRQTVAKRVKRLSFK